MYNSIGKDWGLAAAFGTVNTAFTGLIDNETTTESC